MKKTKILTPKNPRATEIIVPFKTKFVYGQKAMIKHGFYRGMTGTITKATFNEKFDEVVYTLNIDRNNKELVVESSLQKIPLWTRLMSLINKE